MQQERAVAGMRALGGNLMIEAGRFSWLADWLPGEHVVPCQRVLAVTFLGPKVSDAEVDAVAGHLSVLPDLERVTFVDTAITRVGENRLRKRFPHLKIEVIVTASEVWRVEPGNRPHRSVDLNEPVGK